MITNINPSAEDRSFAFLAFLTSSLSDELTAHLGPSRGLDNGSHVLRMQWQTGKGAQVSDGLWSHRTES